MTDEEFGTDRCETRDVMGKGRWRADYLALQEDLRSMWMRRRWTRQILDAAVPREPTLESAERESVRADYAGAAAIDLAMRCHSSR